MADIDECAADDHGCQQLCRNIDGSFECYCRAGYRLDDDGISCSGTETICVVILYYSIHADINECTEGVDECEHMCMNTNGSYNCSCFENYILADNGKSCTSK